MEEKFVILKGWCVGAAKKEDGKDIQAGKLASDPNPTTNRKIDK